jgi:hypothetical protein
LKVDLLDEGERRRTGDRENQTVTRGPAGHGTLSAMSTAGEQRHHDDDLDSRG